MSGGKSPGRRSYEAYRAKAGGVSLVSGTELPAWEELHADIRAAWEAAATAAVRADLPDDVEYRG